MRTKKIDEKYGIVPQGYASSKIGWARYKTGAIRRASKKRGIDFDLRHEDIMNLMVDRCPVLEIELDYISSGHKKHLRNNSPSIDRINNNKGYTKDNVIIISYLANRIKTNLSIDEIIEYLPKVIKYYEEK